MKRNLKYAFSGGGVQYVFYIIDHFLEFSLNILSSLAPDYKLVSEAFPLEMRLV